ncbi:ChaN family lipoprotein [Halpernia sp.]|uniref:ChaN family lipoprotein n=1 Tax=Halpernia sp. TaxID=2782209 RepID=UPI003A8E7A8E
MKKYIILLIIFCFASLKAQELKAFQFYNQNGREIKTEKLIKKLADFDVVLFGEYHNNSMIHWLEFKIAEELYKQKEGKLILGAEMFERDNQTQLNQYLNGKILAKNLKDSVRLWNNYETDYRPIVDFAKEKNLEFIASNIPRKYASLVAKNGLESLNSLSENEKKWIAKLPISVSLETPGYEGMKKMMAEHSGDKAMNFVSAQATKDATMAESIFNNLKTDYTFLHFNGDYHSKEFGGIYWYLRQKYPNLKIAVISIFESENPELLLPTKDFKLTDFNLVIPSDMTKTY